ncbi:MAG: ParB/RepB/Spo0J family partition protein [Synergistaceae bacterium]|jgi:ParB family chromosome partitioning protein|nr:ParB/RepB/Spo0J family partition protein [Synergistaceae bacterium]
MAKQRGLGKGLSSLIPAASTELDVVAAIVEETPENLKTPQETVDVNKLFPNPFQPRKNIDTESLDNLAASIKEHGIIQPVLVRSTAEGFQIIAGERRWRAAKKAGLDKIPVRILEITDSQTMELALIENLQREDLNAIEIAEGIQEMLSKLSITHDEIAVKIGFSRTAVTNKLRLLQLPKQVIKMLENGEITEGHARTVLALPSADKIIEYANLVVEKGLNVRQIEQLVKNYSAAAKIDAAFPRRATEPSEFIDEVERFKNKYKLTLKIDGGRRGMGLQIKGLKKWQLQLLIEYIDNHAEELFPRE